MGCCSGSTICSNQPDALIQFPKPFSNTWLGGLPPILKLELHLPHPACVKFLKILEKEDGKNIHTNVLKETAALGRCGWVREGGWNYQWLCSSRFWMQDYGNTLSQIVVTHLFMPLYFTVFKHELSFPKLVSVFYFLKYCEILLRTEYNAEVAKRKVKVLSRFSETTENNSLSPYARHKLKCGWSLWVTLRRDLAQE